MLRFHLDENADFAVALGLRNRGIDVTTTHESGIDGVTDEQQLAFALREGRVVVTHDDDLLVLHSQGAAHAGIAFNSLRTKSIGQMISALAALSRHFDRPDMIGRVEFI